MKKIILLALVAFGCNQQKGKSCYPSYSVVTMHKGDRIVFYPPNIPHTLPEFNNSNTAYYNAHPDSIVITCLDPCK